jgi:cellulose synthase/poly-beta-1,6-N-acetylglucosamine synthase-like glycosyltransferase
MLPMKLAFWMSAAVVAYAYLGYPLILVFLRLFLHAPTDKATIEPSVSVIVPAYNEQHVIEAKIRNLASLDYPMEKLEVLIASDGSTDRTVEFAERAAKGASVRVLAFAENRGKMSVLNDAVRVAKGEIVVLSDASALWAPESIRHLVANFADPAVGAVSGVYSVRRPSEAQLGDQENLYWKYETFLKTRESEICSVLGGHGQILAVRKELYPYPSAAIINDDYVIPVRVLAGGSRVVYEPKAIAFEEAKEMAGFQRRVRVMAGNIQQIGELSSFLWPPRLLPIFFFVSHKLTRSMVPILMVLIAVANVFLLRSYPYRLLFAVQMLFYGVALAGSRWKLQPGLLRMPFYFCFVSAAYLWGAFGSLQGNHAVKWK